MTDKPPEERALEQAVIDAALAHTAEEKVNHYSELVEACDTLRDFRAPKPEPRCEPADADKDKPYHWLRRIEDGVELPGEWVGRCWYINGEDYSAESIAQDYTYLCVATPPELKVEPTDITKTLANELASMLTFYGMDEEPDEVSGTIHRAARDALNAYKNYAKFSLPAPVDLTDVSVSDDKVWWLAEIHGGRTGGSSIWSFNQSQLCKFARAVLAAGRGL